MIDLLLLLLVVAIFGLGFWAGDKYRTIGAMFAALCDLVNGASK